MGLPHVFNYVLGQINLWVSFLILASLYGFLKYNEMKWDFVGSLLLGITIIIKPITFFIIPFLLLIKFDLKTKKLEIDFQKSIIRIIGFIFPLSLNLIIFLLYPQLWKGFFATNFTGKTLIRLNFSFSITRLILNLCVLFNIPIKHYIVFAIVGLFVVVLAVPCKIGVPP